MFFTTRRGGGVVNSVRAIAHEIAAAVEAARVRITHFRLRTVGCRVLPVAGPRRTALLRSRHTSVSACTSIRLRTTRAARPKRQARTT